MMLFEISSCVKGAWNKCKVGSVLIHSIFPIWTMMMFGTNHSGFAQNNQTDTVGIIEKLTEKKDTMVRYVGWRDLPKKRSAKLDKSIDSVLFPENNTRFKKELHNLLIRGGSGDSSRRKSPTTNTSLAAMDGKIIRRIDFVKVGVFAPSISDTGYIPPTWFEKTANATHYDTRDNILKRYLLINPGDRLDVFQTAENERILRDLSFIMDARFVAMPIQGCPDSTDLILLTQDMFPIGLEAEIVKSTLATFGMSNQNILGLGHQSLVTTYWDTKNKPLVGYRLSYGTSNLFGSFVVGRLEYAHRWNQESYLVDIRRDFRTSRLKNAGGFSIEKTDIIKNIELLDTTLWNVNLKYTNTDFWVGRTLQLNSHSQWIRSGLFFTGRINWYNSLAGPVTYNDYLYSLQDKTLVLFSTGITRQGFRKDNMIYTFGRTEDVPYGYLFDIVSGYEWGQYKTRPYLAIGASYGRYFKSSGYLSGQLKFGTFMNHGSLEQGALRIQAKYFSPLYSPSRFQYRHFLNFTYLHGINRYRGEFATVENKEGIVGLTSPSMRWNDKLVFNLETVIFSPYKLLGFRFAFFGSLDLGLVASENLRMDDTRMFMGVSTGVRIRNDQLVFDNIVLKVGIYPGMPYDATAQYLIFDYLARTRFQDFFPSKPAIINYR
jgi:hypothetical protein